MSHSLFLTHPVCASHARGSFLSASYVASVPSSFLHPPLCRHSSRSNRESTGRKRTELGSGSSCGTVIWKTQSGRPWRCRSLHKRRTISSILSLHSTRFSIYLSLVSLPHSSASRFFSLSLILSSRSCFACSDFYYDVSCIRLRLRLIMPTFIFFDSSLFVFALYV